jgi:hypothetical protein
VIFVGLDDTDSLDSRGTNQLARALAELVSHDYVCRMIVRHQLLFDERIPFTSHNGSAAILLERRSGHLPAPAGELDDLFGILRAGMLHDFIPGSDPGLCVTADVPRSVIDWGLRCQREIVTQEQARELAWQSGIRLEGLGGSHGGIIGALAAIGLAATGNDGRLIRWAGFPDDLSGPTPVSQLIARQIQVRNVPESSLNSGALTADSGGVVTQGIVDVGRHARPNLRNGGAVMFVTAASRVPDASANRGIDWVALKVK